MLALALMSAGCILDSQEAERVDLNVRIADGLDLKANTDTGWNVEVQSARFVLEDVQFTTQGEASIGLGDGSLAWVWSPIRSAHAHPGHLEGGEVIGELPGRFTFDWVDQGGTSLGTGTFLTDRYDSINFRFSRATKEDVSADDELFGHSIRLAGTARRGEEVVDFIALIDEDEGRAMVGGPFQAKLEFVTSVTVDLEFRVFDSVTGTSAFDGIEFSKLSAALNSDDPLVIHADDDATVEAHNRIRNALQRHPYYGAHLTQASE